MKFSVKISLSTPASFRNILINLNKEVPSFLIIHLKTAAKLPANT